MDKPETVNRITRYISGQAFNGVARDIKFVVKESCTPRKFFNRAKPLILSTLELLRKEGKAFKICTTFQFGRNSATISAIRLDDYDLEKVIHQIFADMEDESETTFSRSSIFLVLGVVE